MERDIGVPQRELLQYAALYAHLPKELVAMVMEQSVWFYEPLEFPIVCNVELCDTDHVLHDYGCSELVTPTYRVEIQVDKASNVSVTHLGKRHNKFKATGLKVEAVTPEQVCALRTKKDQVYMQVIYVAHCHVSMKPTGLSNEKMYAITCNHPKTVTSIEWYRHQTGRISRRRKKKPQLIAFV